MKGRISFRHLLFALVAVLVFSVVGYADALITIPAQGVNTFVFQNAHTTATATDFRITVLAVISDPLPAIGGGFGGAPFPMATFQNPANSGGFHRVVYDGGAGIPAGETYTHSFPDWPVGAVFGVSFSYLIGGQVVFLDPKVLEVNTSNGQGFTRPVPELTTLLLLGTGLAGAAIKSRNRFKERKSRHR